MNHGADIARMRNRVMDDDHILRAAIPHRFGQERRPDMGHQNDDPRNPARSDEIAKLAAD